MDWIPTTDRLPEDRERVLFVATEFGYPEMVFYGYRFGNLWFMAAGFYGLEGPDRIAPANIYYWLPVPAVPKVDTRLRQAEDGRRDGDDGN